jgi:lactate permease
MLFSGISMAIFLYIFSNLVDPSITSLATGLLTIIVSIAYIKLIGIKTPDEYRYNPSDTETSEGAVSSVNMKPLVAASPYIILLIMLPVVRFSFPMSTLAKYGYTIWVGLVILASAFIGSLIIKVSISDFGECCGIALKKVIPALIAMCGLLVVSGVMKTTGMMSLLATSLASVAGMAYPAMAVAIGSLGSFMTGTGLGSNIMFGPMHVEAATSLSLNPIVVFSGQNVGASIGNMVCPNNVVAVATTVGILGKEGSIMKKVFPAFFAMLVLYGVLTFAYAMFIFPNFGM